MDNDIWMMYGERAGEVTDTTGARKLSIQETSLPFIFCSSGLVLALLAFLAELCGMNINYFIQHIYQYTMHFYRGEGQEKKSEKAPPDDSRGWKELERCLEEDDT